MKFGNEGNSSRLLWRGRLRLGIGAGLPREPGFVVLASVLQMKMGLHHNERHFAFAFDQVENALDAGFLDLLGFPFEQNGQAIHLGLDAGAERARFPLASRFRQERNRLPNEVGDGFSAIALRAQFLQEIAFLGGNANTKLMALAVFGTHAVIVLYRCRERRIKNHSHPDAPESVRRA